MTDQSRVGPSDMAELSYEQARTEPAAVVERWQAGGGPLGEARALRERGGARQRRRDWACARLEAGAEHTR